MKTKHSIPLVKLPSDMELVLFLIREDLKSAKFFDTLEKVDLSGCFYQSHFHTVILAYMGFAEISDEVFSFYTDLIDEYSERVEEDNALLTDLAVEVYEKILAEKRRLYGRPE